MSEKKKKKLRDTSDELEQPSKIKEQEIEKKRKEVTKKTKKNRKKRTSRKKTKKNNRKIIIIILILIVLLSVFLILLYKINCDKIDNQNKQKQDIINHYNEYVMTNKESDIYQLDNDKFIKAGKIGNKQELTLDTKEITYEDEYLKIKTFEEEYYIYYKDLDIIEELSIPETRYKNYIVFNKNIITKDKTSFYDEEGNLVYTLNSSFNIPIIIKKEDIYGVQFNDRLLYVKKEDISEIEENNNTELTNTKGIAVLNYHFFFDTAKEGDAAKCNQIICLSTTNLKKHLDYIKENNIFTPSMEELEMYIDGYIQLPKSVVLTIDDGWRADIGSKIMSEYEINATVFLMSKHYDPKKYQTEYIEVHSHGHDLHNPGVCPGGQGGAIKCLEKSKLLEDLTTSQEKLSGTTIFCYPFYEYNNYSIEVLKEAGYTMAFGGYGEAGNYKVSPGINKYKLPRYVIYNTTSANDIKNYIG